MLSEQLKYLNSEKQLDYVLAKFVASRVAWANKCLRALQGEAEARAELAQLQRTVKFMEESYLEEHGQWGNCQHRLRAEAAEAELAYYKVKAAELSRLKESLRRLVSDKESNGYPLWFNRAVHECGDCDSEDLCLGHYAMAQRDFTGCEQEIEAFIQALSPPPPERDHNEQGGVKMQDTNKLETCHAARTKLMMKFWAAMHQVGLLKDQEWEAQEKIRIADLVILLRNASAPERGERQPTQPSAREWLESRGLGDLSLYWPTNKPIPQIDYISGEAQPTLESLMEAYAKAVSDPNKKQGE